MSSELCCLKDLYQKSLEKTWIAFIWGSLKYIGIFSSFSIRLTYFSNHGMPLRAEVNLTINCKSDPDEVDDKAMADTQKKLNEMGRRPNPDAL